MRWVSLMCTMQWLGRGYSAVRAIIGLSLPIGLALEETAGVEWCGDQVTAAVSTVAKQSETASRGPCRRGRVNSCGRADVAAPGPVWHAGSRLRGGEL